MTTTTTMSGFFLGTNSDAFLVPPPHACVCVEFDYQEIDHHNLTTTQQQNLLSIEESALWQISEKLGVVVKIQVLGGCF